MSGKVKEMCVLCGKTFWAGPYGRICPACHQQRIREGIARKREINKKEKNKK